MAATIYYFHVSFQLLCQLFSPLINLSVEYLKIVKSHDHNFPEFCLNNSRKPEDTQFTINETKKQRSWKQEMLSFLPACKMIMIIKLVADLFAVDQLVHEINLNLQTLKLCFTSFFSVST